MAKNPIMKPGDIAILDPKDVGGGNASTAGMTEAQKKLRALVERTHPEYKAKAPHWEFLEETYEGGRAWFRPNIFRYIKEGDKEFHDRLDRAYRFNHTREVVDLVNKYLFKQGIVRNDGSEVPECVKRFWKKSTKGGLPIKDFSRQVSKQTSIYGRIGIVVDNNATPGMKSKADEKREGFKTYAYTVGPDQMKDYAFDDDGDLLWILIEEIARDDQDPLTSSGVQSKRWRLWTKMDWKLYEEQTIGRKKVIVLVDESEHGLGEVPVILADNIISDEEYTTPALIDDIAYLDRAVANYLSNLDAIIQDQTFSQLAMPAQNLMPGEDNYNKMLEMGTKRVFLYDGEGGAVPRYISPDPKQAQMILAVINKIINEIYHTVGLAGERTKEDNSKGIDNSSGVAKAFDFERVNALLAAKADSLEIIENKITRLVALWNGEEIDETSTFVGYPDDFDVRGLYDELGLAAQLMLIEAPSYVRQEQLKKVLDKLFPQLAKDLRAKMEKQLLTWPPEPIDLRVVEAQGVSDIEVAEAQAGFDLDLTEVESELASQAADKQNAHAMKMMKAKPVPKPAAKPAAKK